MTMAGLGEEGFQLLVETAVAGIIGVIGVWYLKRRTDRRLAKESSQKDSVNEK
jgi:hypothetical protein